MKLVFVCALVAVAAAAPQQYSAPAPAPTRYSDDSLEHVPILRDDRYREDDGRYSLDVETGNGIVLTQSGSPDGPENAVIKSGQYSYTAPDGTPVVVKFVADENGYQPQSDLLPVAPAFPHEIPQFVLDQIEKAAREDAGKSSEEGYAPPSGYRAP